MLAAALLTGCSLTSGPPKVETVVRHVEVRCPAAKPALQPCRAGDKLADIIEREKCQAIWLRTWERAYDTCGSEER